MHLKACYEYQTEARIARQSEGLTGRAAASVREQCNDKGQAAHPPTQLHLLLPVPARARVLQLLLKSSVRDHPQINQVGSACRQRASNGPVREQVNGGRARYRGLALSQALRHITGVARRDLTRTGHPTSSVDDLEP